MLGIGMALGSMWGGIWAMPVLPSCVYGSVIIATLYFALGHLLRLPVA